MPSPEERLALPRRRPDRDLLAEPEPAREEWAPEPWKRVRAVGETAAEIRHPSTPRARPPDPDSVERAPAPTVRAPRRDDAASRQATLRGHVLALAITGAVALVGSIVPILAVRDGWPRALLAVIGVVIVGLLLSLDGGPTPLTRGWVALLGSIAVVSPVATLTVSVTRMPAIDLLGGTAWMAIWLTVLTTVVVVAQVAGIAVWSLDSPEESAILTLPTALILVSLVGVRGELHQAAAAQAIGVAALAAGLAGGMLWASTPTWRPYVPSAVFALYVLALWIVGRGPSWHGTSGAIAPVLVGWIYILAALITVVTVPLAALSRQVERESRTTAW